jgi:hypothetical protein
MNANSMVVGTNLERIAIKRTASLGDKSALGSAAASGSASAKETTEKPTTSHVFIRTLTRRHATHSKKLHIPASHRPPPKFSPGSKAAQAAALALSRLIRQIYQTRIACRYPPLS